MAGRGTATGGRPGRRGRALPRGKGGTIVRPDADPACRLRIGTALRLRGRFVHLHSVGEGRPVLLLHGCGSLAEDILGALPPVEGIRWIAPDRPGHGYTEPLPDAGPQAAADWLADLIDVLGLPPVQVVAHSMAAAQALWLAATHPGKVRAVTLLAPLCHAPRMPVPVLGLLAMPGIGPLLRRRLLPHVVPLLGARALAPLIAPDAPPPLLRAGLMDHLLQDQTLATIRAELRSLDAAMQRLPQVGCPVLAVTGGLDRIAPPGAQLPWLKAVAPDLDLIEIVDAGHDLHRSAPLRVLAAVLSQAEAAGPRAPHRPRGDAQAERRAGWQGEGRAL